MKSEIPYEKTKEYWDKKIPDMRQQSLKKSFLKTTGSVILISFLFLFCAVLDIGSESFPVWLMIWGIFLGGALMIQIVIFFYAPLRIRLNGNTDPIIVSKMVFYDIEGTWGQIYGPQPGEDPLNHLFPEDMVVFEFRLFYKENGKKRIHRCHPYLYCIGTMEKYWETEQLIHMKESAVPRKESRKFNVTYKKYSRELLEIRLDENEFYPENCYYEERLNRINILF